MFEKVMLDLIESVCDSSCLFISISGTWANYEKKRRQQYFNSVFSFQQGYSCNGKN